MTYSAADNSPAFKEVSHCNLFTKKQNRRLHFERPKQRAIVPLHLCLHCAEALELVKATKDLGIQRPSPASEGTQSGEAETPILDQDLREFVTRVLQQKCVKVEMAEGREKIGILNEKNEKWENKRAKFIRKVSLFRRLH